MAVTAPRATLSEIEQALDERLGKMRARMLQDAALASSAANIRRRKRASGQCAPSVGRSWRAGGKTSGN